jgi:hypothetical protein
MSHKLYSPSPSLFSSHLTLLFRVLFVTLTDFTHRFILLGFHQFTSPLFAISILIYCPLSKRKFISDIRDGIIYFTIPIERSLLRSLLPLFDSLRMVRPILDLLVGMLGRFIEAVLMNREMFCIVPRKKQMRERKECGECPMLISILVDVFVRVSLINVWI